MTAAGKPVVHTIGHSNREFDDVVAMLTENGVTDLVDIRRFPGSRRYPQWNQDAIVDRLPPEISYRWARDLGGRRYSPVAADSPNTGWRVKAFQDYADHLDTDEFRRAADDLATLAADRKPVIMCSEAVPWRCHRRLITDALLVRGVDVRHIMGPGSVRPAELTPFAHVDGDRLIYPAETS